MRAWQSAAPSQAGRGSQGSFEWPRKNGWRQRFSCAKTTGTFQHIQGPDSPHQLGPRIIARPDAPSVQSDLPSVPCSTTKLHAQNAEGYRLLSQPVLEEQRTSLVVFKNSISLIHWRRVTRYQVIVFTHALRFGPISICGYCHCWTQSSRAKQFVHQLALLCCSCGLGFVNGGCSKVLPPPDTRGSPASVRIFINFAASFVRSFS